MLIEYRKMLQLLRLIPADSRQYYHYFCKQNWLSHQNEIDEERINFILRRGKQDAEWVLSKFGLNPDKVVIPDPGKSETLLKNIFFANSHRPEEY